ncbi:hypothetical protein FKM82_022235 [Ascaphus truei]
MKREGKSESIRKANRFFFIKDESAIQSKMKKISDVNGKNNLLEIQLEKSIRMWKLSQTKEIGSKEGNIH